MRSTCRCYLLSTCKTYRPTAPEHRRAHSIRTHTEVTRNTYRWVWQKLQQQSDERLNSSSQIDEDATNNRNRCYRCSSATLLTHYASFTITRSFCPAGRRGLLADLTMYPSAAAQIQRLQPAVRTRPHRARVAQYRCTSMVVSIFVKMTLCFETLLKQRLAGQGSQ